MLRAHAQIQAHPQKITFLREKEVLITVVFRDPTMEKGTSSRPSSGSSYEVFLSFRGADTRYGFTDCLYHDMVEAGIIVFRDNESLHVGKEIGGELLQAIENSKIYIPIFSKNYASSHWCLRELAHMVECTSKSNGNKEILPIFLDVEPEDVKLKTDLYSQALSKRQKIWCTEFESWEKALIEVGKLKGWNLKKDQGQGNLIRSVVRTISVKLKVAHENVTEHLVGVDDRVGAIIKMLDAGYDSVQYLGIHGMGGVGKTTLAKVVFNTLSSNFDRHCFLANVGELAKGNNGQVNLQKQLLSKLLGSHSIDQIDHVNDGINMMNKGVLTKKKVLIVLDDVDEKEQFKTLAGKCNWFGAGSGIIVTTRDQSVLTIEGEATSEGLVKKFANISMYDVREMEFDHALKLFSRHAFGRDSPPDHRVSLSKDIVLTLGKLPLALEITGSSLNSKPEALWVDTLKKLKEAPPMGVQRKLMISYERLDYAQRQVFLDIACLFVYGDKTYPFYMWDACGYYPHDALEVLVLTSLIKIKYGNTFWMHDQVRDLGREIVRQENFNDPCERSRVWNPEEALSIMKRKEGSRKTEALLIQPPLSLFRPFHEEILAHDGFANLRNPRFFYGDGVILAGDFNNLLSSLRWQIRKLPYWIEELVKIRRLDLSECTKLKELPDSVGKLQSLVELDLSSTTIGHLPDSIGDLKQLKVLRIRYVKGIAKLPSAIGLVEKLEELDAHKCDNLTGEIPEEIGRLFYLRILDLSYTHISGLPAMMSRLSNLQTLNLERCTELKWLPELPPRLISLGWGSDTVAHVYEDMSYEPESVTALPISINTLSQLEKLTLSCENMQFLPQLPSSLRELQLQNLATRRSPDFSNLKNLSILTLCGCSMPELCGIFDAELEVLSVELCKFRKLDALFQLEMERLRCLTMSWCEFLPEVVDLSRMKNLEDVFLSDCKSLLEIRGLEELGSLCSLRVERCSFMERMSDLSRLKRLNFLGVENCPKLRSVEGLNHLESLKVLSIFNAGEFGGDTSNLNLEYFIIRTDERPDREEHCKDVEAKPKYLRCGTAMSSLSSTSVGSNYFLPPWIHFANRAVVELFWILGSAPSGSLRASIIRPGLFRLKNGQESQYGAAITVNMNT
ncbi:disease resistance protein L6-like [Rhodamnia argentea]|uniref:Disease resistance protein L6-like n=1 Tax=Rhodamnia argentea TaxID=178133 RepID=A0A8B8Q115_9MYRT|nr:disease resistance protein L6-like [Rhodamnia argentea]